MASENWNCGTLGEIAEIKTGKLDSNAAVAGGRFPFFTCSPDTLKINTAAFDCEAAILAGNNANGVFSVKYFHGKFNAYQRTYVITSRDHKSVDIKYLYYQLQQLTTLLQEYSIGTATKFLTRTILDPLVIPLPPLAEQKAIAAVLGALDDKIELNRRMNATLESMARALFQSWFVDFDPVRAKLDGRKLEEIDPKIFIMFPNTLETTEEGIVPTGWKFAPLTDVYDVSSGLSKPRADFGFGHPFLTFTNVMNNRFIPQNLTSLVNSNDAERSRCTVERGDVFLTRTSETQEELGMSCAALHSYPQATFNGFTKRLRPKGTSPLVPEYAGFYFRSAKFRRDVTAMSSLSTRASLNNEMLSRLKVLMPPLLICEAFANHVSPMLRRMQSNEVESKQLAALRDTLLPKLLSGELSVVDAERFVGVAQV